MEVRKPDKSARFLWREDVRSNWRVWSEFIRITRLHRKQRKEKLVLDRAKQDLYDVPGLSRAEAKALTHIQNYDTFRLLAHKQENK